MISLSDIRAARERIAGAVRRTPMLRPGPTTTPLAPGADIVLKLECLQVTGSFKARGALNKLRSLAPEEIARGIVTASGGNHGIAVAYAGRAAGTPAIVYVPTGVAPAKAAKIKGYGAELRIEGSIWDEANRAATALAATGVTYFHPFADDYVMAGQGTVALELLGQAPDIDVLIVPVGGGGLISGCATVAKAKGGIEVIGVEAELYPSMYNRIKGTSLPCHGDTLAEGIAVKEPGSITANIVQHLVDDIMLVSERHLEQSVSLLLQIEKTVVEGAGAAGLAALIANPERFAGKTVGIVLCGGNIDTRLLANVLLRDLARSGRLARLRIKLQDRPGALYNVARIFDQEQVNIIEVYHQRVFSTLPAKGLITDIECETRDAAHLARLMAALEEEGYEVSQVELA